MIKLITIMSQKLLQRLRACKERASLSLDLKINRVECFVRYTDWVDLYTTGIILGGVVGTGAGSALMYEPQSPFSDNVIACSAGAVLGGVCGSVVGVCSPLLLMGLPVMGGLELYYALKGK